MPIRLILWLVPTVLYVIFFAWYTDLRGPLGPDEIDAFARAAERRGFEPDRVARLRTFMEADSGRQFFMLNALDMADAPPDVPGAPPGASADDLMALYMEHMYPQLFKRASHPVVFGDAIFEAMDLAGIDGAESWSAGAFMRYRSRRSFMEVVTHPDMRGRHAFKIAALEKTIAYPVETRVNLGDPRLLLGLLLLSGTALADIAYTARRGRGTASA